MNNVIDLTSLYQLQAKLDQEIATNHQINYETTSKKRLLSLIVELGELANETRCFKYWSTRQNGDMLKIMDEYADGMHFFLSLGIPLHVKKMKYEINDSFQNLTDGFLKTYQLVVDLIDNYDEVHYTNAYQSFLNLAFKIGMSVDDIIASYKKKLDVNYSRQKNSY